MSQAAAQLPVRDRIPRKALVGLIGGAFALLIAAALSAWLVVPGLVADEQADHASGDEAIIDAKTAMQTRFTDAQSVTYGPISVNWLGDTPVVCGRVDITQDQDSFDGRERFVFTGGQLAIEEVDGTPFVQQKWDDTCKAA